MLYFIYENFITVDLFLFQFLGIYDKINLVFKIITFL